MGVTLPNDGGCIGLEVDVDTVLACAWTVDSIMLDDRSGHVQPLRAATFDGLEPDGVAHATCYQQTPNTPAAYVGVDVAGETVIGAGDLTVQWIGTLSVAANVFDGRVANRGLGGSAPERQSWCVYFDTDSAAPIITLGWQWDDLGGTSRQAVVGLPAWVPADTWTLWTVTRRRESATSVVLRCYVGDQLAAEWTSTHGDIAGSTAATTVVLGGDGFGGKIDQLRVVTREVSLEEVQQTWARLTVHQPTGEAAVRALSPPGVPWYRLPSSGPARLARIAGQAVGYGAAKTAELLATWLPAHCYADRIADWERMVGARPAAGDGLEARRARVLRYFQRVAGYAVPQVQELLAEAFDQLAVDVDVREFSADVADEFNSIDDRRWLVNPRSATSWTALTKTARVQAALAADIRIEPGAISGPTLEMACEVAPDSYDACKLTLTALPADCEAGLLLRCGWRGDRLFFGVRNTAGTYQVVYQRWRAGVLDDVAPVALDVTANVPHWFRIRIDPSPAVFAGDGELRLQLEWSTDGTTFDVEPGVLWVDDWNWCGFYARGTDAALASALDVRFADHRHREHRGRRAYRWYAYRDLGLGGAPHLEQAQALVVGVKPAHTHAAAISSLDVLCDNAGSGCDRGPMGAI